VILERHPYRLEPANIRTSNSNCVAIATVYSRVFDIVGLSVSSRPVAVHESGGAASDPPEAERNDLMSRRPSIYGQISLQ